ncbi:MAG: cytochrome c [Pseudomonadota bacterium]|nr:cytochrome c [Pseudomonadota bacterium]
MKRSTFYLAALACVTGFAAEGVMAAGEPSGRAIAVTCAGCHGPDGHSVGPVPSLAGLPAAHIEQQLKDFKSGARPGTIMDRIAKGYDDANFAAVAKYYSKIK